MPDQSGNGILRRHRRGGKLLLGLLLGLLLLIRIKAWLIYLLPAIVIRKAGISALLSNTNAAISKAHAADDLGKSCDFPDFIVSRGTFRICRNARNPIDAIINNFLRSRF